MKDCRYKKTMLLTLASILFALMAPLWTQAGAETSPNEELVGELQRARSIHLYILSRTGEYDYTVDEIKEHASVRIYRSCGLDCSNLMGDIVDQMRMAEPRSCVKGQQNALIEFSSGGWIIYSNGGHRIQYKGICYSSSVSVISLLRRPGLIF